MKFGNNILAENNNFALELTADDLEGLPSGVRDAAREKAQAMGKGDKWVFTLHKPSLIPFLTYSAKRDLREKIYNAYLNRCNNGDQYDNKQAHQRLHPSAYGEGQDAGLSVVRRLCRGRRDGRHDRCGLRAAGPDMDAGA